MLLTPLNCGTPAVPRARSHAVTSLILFTTYVLTARSARSGRDRLSLLLHSGIRRVRGFRYKVFYEHGRHNCPDVLALPPRREGGHSASIFGHFPRRLYDQLVDPALSTTTAAAVISGSDEGRSGARRARSSCSHRGIIRVQRFSGKPRINPSTERAELFARPGQRFLRRPGLRIGVGEQRRLVLRAPVVSLPSWQHHRTKHNSK